MSEPLCPSLYRRLEERFGSVIIASQGEEMVRDIRMPVLASRIPGHSNPQFHGPQFLAHGEYYRVNCCRCNDTRHRLWINHRFSEYPWMAVCYNEGCFNSKEARQSLYMMIFRTSQRHRLLIRTGQKSSAQHLSEVTLPGVIIPIRELSPDHPAIRYLRDERGFDVNYLDEQYQISFCQRASQGLQTAEGRIIIPIQMRGKLVGWQARFIGERDWKTASAPKYWGMPRMNRRLMLYNFDQARQQPYVVLVEGTTDVWSFGPEAMGLLSKHITMGQKLLLANAFRDTPVVVMLDSEAVLENEGTFRDLRRILPAGVVRADLPAGTDPGTLKRSYMLRLITRCAEQQRVYLPGLGAKR